MVDGALLSDTLGAVDACVFDSSVRVVCTQGPNAVTTVDIGCSSRCYTPAILTSGGLEHGDLTRLRL